MTAPVVIGPTIIASINGRCPCCGDQITAGVDQISYTDVGWALAAHADDQQP